MTGPMASPRVQSPDSNLLGGPALGSQWESPQSLWAGVIPLWTESDWEMLGSVTQTPVVATDWTGRPVLSAVVGDLLPVVFGYYSTLNTSPCHLEGTLPQVMEAKIQAEREATTLFPAMYPKDCSTYQLW